MSPSSSTRNWPELAVGLYDKLTDRNAEIAYQFENLELGVPDATGGDVQHALWHMNGTLRVTTRNIPAN